MFDFLVVLYFHLKHKWANFTMEFVVVYFRSNTNELASTSLSSTDEHYGKQFFSNA